MWSANAELWEWLKAEADSHDRYLYSHPLYALRFNQTSDLIRAVTSSGSHYFCAATMRMFRCRTYELVGSQFLIVSDMSPNGRIYRVAYATSPPETTRLSMERSSHLSSLYQARAFARELVALLAACPDSAELIRRAKNHE